MPTIVDVAREAKVSTAAVSLVLNDPHTNRVGQDKKKEILRVAKRLGYAPNGLAKALIQGSTRILGLVVPLRDPIFFNYFIAEVLSGIQSCLMERNYHLMIFSHSAKSGKITRSQILRSKFVDGLIFINTRMCTDADMDATIQEVSTAEIPFVMVNAYYGHSAINYVGVDDRQIGYAAGAYLLDKGHRRIALLDGARRSPMRVPLAEGFQKALRDRDVRWDPALSAFGEFDSDTTRKAALAWFRLKERPTAIFCSDAQMAPNLYEFLRDANLRIPQDVAILGRGDFISNRYLTPRLTTLRLPTFEMGGRAAELLVNSLGGQNRVPQRILLPSELIERESV